MNFNKPFQAVSLRRLAASIALGSLLAGGVGIALSQENVTTSTKGNLVFANLEKEIVLEVGETSKEISFGFTNKGQNPIRIVGIKSSCGCTVPEFEKKEYAPGESGILNVSFKSSSGVQNTSGTVLLVSDEEKDNFYTLRLLVTRKQVARLSSQKEEWEIGSAPVEREIIVDIIEKGTHIIEVSSNNDAFDVRMVTIEPNQQYRIKVRPRTNEYPASGSLRLQTTNEKQPFLTAKLAIK